MTNRTDEAAPAGEGGDRSAAPALDALLALAARAADEGNYSQVTALFRAAVAGGTAAADAARWHRLLVEAGDFAGAAEAARLGGLQETGEAEAAADDGLAGAAGEGADDVLDFEPGVREPAETLVAPALVGDYLRWFAGRADVHARQWYDARRDRSGYWPVRAALTPAVATDHLLGRVTLGQYVVHPDNTVGFAVLDLDPTAEALEMIRLAEGGEGALASEPLVSYARRLVGAAARAGLPLFPEETGGVGLHLWIFFSPRVPAARARAVLREVLFRAGPQPPGVTVEIFPKQDQLTGKGLGNLVKLPLGVHQATLRRSRFLDPVSFAPVDDAAGVAALRAADPAALEALLASRVVPLPVPGAPQPGDVEPLVLPAGPTPRQLAEALAAIPPGRPSVEAADRILEGCAVLRELARRAFEERRLAPDAARALVYTVGLVGRENPRIEEMLAHAGVSRKELERVRRGLQSPTGCKKLRERFPDLCRGCACPEPAPGGYATPVLFAFHAPPPAARTPAPWLEPGDVVEPTLPGPAAGEALEQRLARIEAALARLLALQGGHGPPGGDGGEEDAG